MIGYTKLQSINFKEHLGLHVSDIGTLAKAYFVRRVLEEIMEEINSTGMVKINKPNEGNNNQYDLFLYGEYFESKLKTIKKRLIERL